MTTPAPPLPVPEDDPLDAAASAVVDGIATSEEAALVAAAPDGAARVAALRGVSETVGSPVGGQDPAAADRALARALDAFDHDAAAEGGDAGGRAPASVTDLPAPPPAGASARSLHRLAAIAAALFLLVGIGALSAAVLTSDSDTETTQSAAPPAADVARTKAESTASGAAGDAAGGGAAVAPATAAPHVAPAGTAAPASRDAAAAAPETVRPAAGAVAGPASAAPVVDGGDLGRQDDLDALARQAAAALDGDPDAGVLSAESAPPSDVQACISATAPAGGTLRYRAVGMFQGTPAVFLVVASENTGTPPSRLLLVLSRSGCGTLARATL